MARLHGYGLTIESAFDVPGATRPAEAAGAPDMIVEAGSVPAPTEGPRRGLFQLSEGRIVIDCAAGRLACERGAAITVDAARGASAQDVGVALAQLALPTLIWMRGDIVLHASAAVPPGERAAVVFLGPSGAGKSTVLRRLLAEGAGVVADDTVRLSDAGGRLTVSGLPALIWDADDGDSAARGVTVVAERARVDAAPLGAFCWLGTGASGETASPPARLQALLASRYRCNPARLLGLVPAMLPRLGAIARSTPFLDRVPGAAQRA